MSLLMGRITWRNTLLLTVLHPPLVQSTGVAGAVTQMVPVLPSRENAVVNCFHMAWILDTSLSGGRLWKYSTCSTWAPLLLNPVKREDKSWFGLHGGGLVVCFQFVCWFDSLSSEDSESCLYNTFSRKTSPLGILLIIMTSPVDISWLADWNACA